MGGGGFLGFRSRYRDGACHGCYGGCFGSCYGCYGGCVGSYGLPLGYEMVGPSAPVGLLGMPPPLTAPPAPDGTVLPPTGLGETVAPPAPGGILLPPAGLGETTAPPAGVSETPTAPNQATVVVKLPADARLYANGELLPLTGPVRVFLTPALEPNRTYYYDLKIEVERGGKTVTREQKNVELQAGKVANVTFPDPANEPPPAKSTARITVRVPDGATLYVEGRPWNFGDARRVIQTPPLTPGRTHYYTLQVRVERDGRRETLTREVAFRAGQDVAVDFSAAPPVGVAKR
jgi:uncharacterized protein (TIGR03000 family)